jgi:membrane protease YdiL (CAAX protease family)
MDLLIESSLQARIVTAFLAAATGPFVEELVYRGVLYPALQRTIGIVWAVAVVSILFAGVHVFQYYNNLAVIAVISVLSVTLTMVRAKTGKLLPSFMIHLVFNGIQSVILVLQPFIEKADQVVPNKIPSTLITNILRHLI